MALNSKRRWGRRALFALVGVGSFALMIRWFEYRQVYQPSRQLAFEPEEAPYPCEDVYFEAEDGTRLNAWFFPALEGARRPDWAALICHGNAGNVSHRGGLARLYLELGANALVFDYRGYGRSEGNPTEEGTYLDAMAAYDWLRKRGFAAEKILAHGESLGGGVAPELALRRPVGGVVLQSAFSSVADLGAELFPFLPVRWMNTIRYDTRGKLPRLQAPLLILHSREDRLIDFSHAERNFAAARDPKTLRAIEGGHNDHPEADWTGFVSALEEFLSQRDAAGVGVRRSE